MKSALKYLFLALLLPIVAKADVPNLSDETLKYKVMFKWGLVNKVAGYVSISLDAKPDRYNGILTAASAPWADKFYKVRDTLYCDIKREGFLPQRYEKISHEGNTFDHDVVTYHRKGGTTIGECTRYQEKDGKPKKDERRTLEASGTTLDMFSAFYYMRSLPFDSWQKGHVEKCNIFSGRRKELLTIHYEGEDDVEYDGKKEKCYKITFTFTSDGKEKTSDDMMAWITVRPERLPIKLEGKLPVGSIRCYLIEN